MKTKTILWSVVSILIIGVAAAAVWWLRRPQVITFSDDSKLTLLSVEYGRRHAPPTVKASTTSTNKAPARRGGSSFTTSNDTLVVWVRQEYDSKQYHYFQFYAYDKAWTACVGNSMTHYANTGRRNGNDIVGIEFNAFPRRQGKFLVGVQEQSNGGQEIADQKFVISNPARGPFTKWTAESLPAVKEDDDLSVTLTRLVFGADTPYQRNQDNPDDPVNKGVQAAFQVQRNGKTAGNWQPVSVETSDATGNQTSWNWSPNGGMPGPQWNDNEGSMTYQYGLWPDEPAWKIKFEFSQQSDFAANELWTVQNIPLQPGRQRDFNTNARNSRTNAVVAETDLNGAHLKIFPAKQFTDVGQNNYMQGGLTIQVDPALPDGMRMTLVKLTDDQMLDVGTYDYGMMRSVTGGTTVSTYRFALRDISGATNLNLTLALHKSRYVEFTAKPEKAAAVATQ
jgi:hypothetical protein